MTGYFPAQHGVKYTLEEDMPADEYPQVEMPLDLPNIGTVIATAAGYTPVYKGKWHLQQAGRATELRARGRRPVRLGRAGTRRTAARTRTSTRRAAAPRTTTAAS